MQAPASRPFVSTRCDCGRLRAANRCCCPDARPTDRAKSKNRGAADPVSSPSGSGSDTLTCRFFKRREARQLSFRADAAPPHRPSHFNGGRIQKSRRWRPLTMPWCLTSAAQGCRPETTALVREVPLAQLEYTVSSLPASLEGRLFYCMFGVCARAPAHCEFAASRAVTWFVPPDSVPVPLAHPPLQYHQVRNYVLSWTHAGGPAVSYRLCFASSTTSCGQTGSIVAHMGANRSHRLNSENALRYGYDRFAGREVRWSVAACNPAGCTWSGNTGSLRLPPKASCESERTWPGSRGAL